MSAILVVVMGVSGVGKSTVGGALALRLGWTFIEADDEHSPASVTKMSGGQPLTDQDRAGWIEAVRARARAHLNEGDNVVLACSALRHAHRARIRSAGPRVEFVHLVAPAQVVEERLAARTGHFAGPALLPSQLDDLEEPRDALTLDARRPVSELVDRIVEALEL